MDKCVLLMYFIETAMIIWFLDNVANFLTWWVSQEILSCMQLDRDYVKEIALKLRCPPLSFESYSEVDQSISCVQKLLFKICFENDIFL
jgi:hypothetical protein